MSGQDVIPGLALLAVGAVLVLVVICAVFDCRDRRGSRGQETTEERMEGRR